MSDQENSHFKNKNMIYLEDKKKVVNLSIYPSTGVFTERFIRGLYYELHKKRVVNYTFTPNQECLHKYS